MLHPVAADDGGDTFAQLHFPIAQYMSEHLDIDGLMVLLLLLLWLDREKRRIPPSTGQEPEKQKQTSDDSDDNHNQRYHNGLANKLAGTVAGQSQLVAQQRLLLLLALELFRSVMDARGRVGMSHGRVVRETVDDWTATRLSLQPVSAPPSYFLNPFYFSLWPSIAVGH